MVSSSFQCNQCGLRDEKMQHCDRWDCDRLTRHQRIDGAAIVSRVVPGRRDRFEAGFCGGQGLLGTVTQTVETTPDGQPVADLWRSLIVPGFRFTITRQIVHNEVVSAGCADDDLSNGDHSDI